MSRLNELQIQKWFQVLSEQVKKASITETARQIGYSRSTVSLVLSGKYDGGTAAIAAKVLETFTDLVLCPFLDADINKGQCNDYQSWSHRIRHHKVGGVGPCPHLKFTA